MWLLLNGYACATGVLSLSVLTAQVKLRLAQYA
ncbi:hypothetical protein SAMN05444064_104243 [Pseudomonas syringae]|nr:hypothetical protein SAMN05444514_104244 [Pseudomonas syringae]SFL79179.1 hypothetical protein SAMN05444064_104243 [Pseudomonas syringae]